MTLGVWQGTNKALQVGHGATYTSTGLGIVNSPVVVYKERQLTKEDSEFIECHLSPGLRFITNIYRIAFRNALNGIREQQGRLAEQNDILSAEIDDLESEVER